MSTPNSTLDCLPQPSEAALVDFGLEGETAIQTSHHYMVALLLTRRPHITGFVGTIPSVWRQRSGLPIRPVRDHFVFQFDREAVRNKILHGGPWFYHDAMLVVAKYDEFSAVESIPLRVLETWVTERGIPHPMRNRKTLMMIGSSIGQVIKPENLALVRKDDDQRVRITMDTRQRFRFHREYCFASVKVNVEITYEKIHGLCRDCGLFEHVVEGCDRIFVKEHEALHGVPTEALAGLNLMPKKKNQVGGFLDPATAAKAKVDREIQAKIRERIKATTPALPTIPAAPHLQVSKELSDRVLKACKAGGFAVPPLVEQQRSMQRGKKRNASLPLVQPGKKMTEIKPKLVSETSDLVLYLPQEQGKLTMTPPAKKKGGRLKGSQSKSKEVEPRPVLKGRKKFLHDLETETMETELIPIPIPKWSPIVGMESEDEDVRKKTHRNLTSIGVSEDVHKSTSGTMIIEEVKTDSIIQST